MFEILSIEELKQQSSEDFQIVFNQKRYYKYVSLSVAENHILPNQTLRFNNPEVFNDPFDCNENLLDFHIEGYITKSLISERLKKTHPSVRDFMHKQMLNPVIYQEALKKEKVNFKVCCFSTKSENILMWSHYADKHSGICFGFEFPYRGDFFTMYPVRYIDKIKKLHAMANVATIFNYWLTRKPVCWAYENETRAISRSGMDDIKFEHDKLKEVIFGCRISTEKIKQVKDQMINYGFKDITFKRMEIDPATFLLKTIEL